MKATLLQYKKDIYPDGSIAETIIWQLPASTRHRPHGYKYRINYCSADGKTRVRYDNKLEKGDHKHIYETELPYEFESLEKLLSDFYKDVEMVRRWLWQKREE